MSPNFIFFRLCNTSNMRLPGKKAANFVARSWRSNKKSPFFERTDDMSSLNKATSKYFLVKLDNQIRATSLEILESLKIVVVAYVPR